MRHFLAFYMMYTQGVELNKTTPTFQVLHEKHKALGSWKEVVL